jgi:uncharacterized YigZ family protein
MEDSFKSLDKPAEGSFRDRNSRFLAFGYPVETLEEINEILASLKKKYHDARHHCYAFRLGPAKDVIRLNDDGEPSGTAARPIFGQLLTHDLSDTMVVVVRYFGGTLLGTGGLIQAYRNATADMISNAIIIEKYVLDPVFVSFPFEGMNQVMKILKEEHLSFRSRSTDTRCSLEILVRKSLTETITGRLSAISGVMIKTG